MDIILLNSLVKYIYVVMFNINMSQITQLVVTFDHHLLRHIQMLFNYILHLHGPSLTEILKAIIFGAHCLQLGTNFTDL